MLFPRTLKTSTAPGDTSGEQIGWVGAVDTPSAAHPQSLAWPSPKPRIINSPALSQPAMSTPTLLIRPSTAADVPAIAAVYGWNVLNGTGTFELDAPSEDEMARRRDDVLAKGLPWLVAESAGRVLGYAYAGQFRPRPAYRYCLEDSIYLAPEAKGRGVGRLLLAELLAQCEARGARQMLAVIGDSANAASIGVHRALGLE